MATERKKIYIDAESGDLDAADTHQGFLRLGEVADNGSDRNSKRNQDDDKRLGV